jgi:hypothetical protein
MGHGHDLKNFFSLTPAGAIGMPDRDVDAGKFDRPGMSGMGHGQDMEGIGHGSDHTGIKMDSKVMGHALHTTHDPGLNKKDKRPSPHPMDRGEHQTTEDDPADRGGKKFTYNFGLMATDISARKNLARDGMGTARPWPPYARLRSVRPTAFDRGKPVREIRLTLDGDMERYVWLLNNRVLSESDDILIKKGEVARFIMINRTMMHHPMHLHGHFFRVLNGHKDYAPLKHTVDVAPMSTTVIEFDANEFGDWFFHCHLLYHMKSGMARVIHYENYQPGPDVEAVRPAIYKESWYTWAQADILSNMTEGFLTLSNTRNRFMAQWEVGWQVVEEIDWETLWTWDRIFNRFFGLFAGLDVLGEGVEEVDVRGIFGIRYLLPFNFESRIWVDTSGGGRITLEKEFHLTPRISLKGEVEYDTHTQWEGKVGLNYTINKNISLIGQWHSDFSWGSGLQIRF